MHCGKPLENETAEYCRDCGRRKSYVRQGRALWQHREPVSGSLYRMKYRNKRSYAAVFAREMAQCYNEQVKRWQIEEIMPVPLHPSRKRKRGYNQAELIAEKLAELLEIKCRTDVLLRIKKTIPQKKLDDGERRENLKGAFAVSAKWRPCKNVLLIDDIYTTGSTVERAAKMLKKAGVQNVYFLTVSIGQGV